MFKRKTSLFPFLVVFGILLGSTSYSFSQQQEPNAPSNPLGRDNLQDSLFLCEKKDGIATCTTQSDPIQMFRGWSQLYKGYDRSPIMFDSIRTGKSRVYPQLAYNTDSSQKEFTNTQKTNERNASLRVLNLGVDDEVNKTSMTMYQPLFFHAQDFAADRNERDRHLDLFQTTRAIAIMTLSYLDKTVAAGLATTQAQVDAHTSNQLLKQLNWTSAKLANPNKMPLYNDVDEKVEACMVHLQAAKTVTGRVEITEPICRPCLKNLAYTPTTRMNGGATDTGGTYDYCVCCAERMSLDVNSTVRNGTEKGGNTQNVYSLVSRIFLGIEGPKSTGDTNKVNALDYTIRNFRRMYGDVVLAPCGTQPYDGDATGVSDTATCTPETRKIEYQFPTYSVSDKIALFRDGLNQNCRNQTEDGSACPLTGTPITDGICPAILNILTQWPPLKGNVEEENELRRLWIQASLGRLITGDDINNMFIMMGRDPGDLRGQFEEVTLGNGLKERRIKPAIWNTVNSRFKRFLNVYCDAAAISAFKKFHVRMQSIVEDHLRMNQKASDYEKGRVRDLVARVSNQIELAERDLESSSVADKMLAGLDSESDRERVSQMGAAAEAQDSAFWNEQMKNKITLWNWYRSK